MVSARRLSCSPGRCQCEPDASGALSEEWSECSDSHGIGGAGAGAPGAENRYPGAWDEPLRRRAVASTISALWAPIVQWVEQGNSQDRMLATGAQFRRCRDRFARGQRCGVERNRTSCRSSLLRVSRHPDLRPHPPGCTETTSVSGPPQSSAGGARLI